MKLIQHSFSLPLSASRSAGWHTWGWIFFTFAILGSFQVASAATPKVTIIPFISTDKGSQSIYVEASTKLGNKLRKKQIKIVAADSKGRQNQEFSLPFKNTYKRAKTQYAVGKSLLRTKKPDKARSKLSSALKNFEKGLAHVREFGELIELYRLLGLCYFRMGMGDEGEEVIRLLGGLVPRYKFSVSKMPPAMRRVLKRAQKRVIKSKNKLIVTVPSGSFIQLDKLKSENVSGDVPINKLASGKHYLWVRKKGFIPYAQMIRLKRGTTRITVKLKPIPQASGPNLSSQIATLRTLLQKRQLTKKVGRLSQQMTDALSVDAVVMGYFNKKDNKNNLHIFIYQKSSRTLKRFPAVGFDEELLELDIKLITLGSNLKSKLLSLGSLPTQVWSQPIAVVAPRPAPRTRTAPAVRVAVARPRPQPRTAVRTSGSDDDDDDDDLDNPKDVEVVGPKIVRKPPPRPVVRRVVPKPVVRKVVPKPVVRKVVPRPVRPSTSGSDDDDDDDDDDDNDTVTRKVPPRPVVRRVAPKPVVRRIAPKPRKVPSTVLNSIPDSLKRDRAALKRDKRKGRRIARLSRRRTRRSRGTRRNQKNFDPDRDIDWSNPIPQPGQTRRIVAIRSVRPEPIVRRRPTRPRAIEPRPVEPRPVEPRPVEPRPTSPPKKRQDHDDDPFPTDRKTEPTPRRGGVGWSNHPDIPPVRRRPKSVASNGVMTKWWFWAAIGGGVAIGAGTAIGLAVIHSQPASSYNVLIHPNPPQ